MARYTKPSLVKLIAQLEAWTESSQDALDTEESRDYPSDVRVDMLTNRIDALQQAIESLQEIE